MEETEFEPEIVGNLDPDKKVEMFNTGSFVLWRLYFTHWEDRHQMKLLQAYHMHEIIGFDSIGL